MTPGWTSWRRKSPGVCGLKTAEGGKFDEPDTCWPSRDGKRGGLTEAFVSCKDGCVNDSLTGVANESHRRRGGLNLYARAG